jgi:hypothetical protein
VTEANGLVCSLDILFLRPEKPGSILGSAGDIDNRIKTLIDALRIPADGSEMKRHEGDDPDPNPMYCLLQDDALITTLKVETDRLLFTRGDSEHESILVICVETFGGAHNPFQVLSLLGVHAHPHPHPHDHLQSRRDFFRFLIRGALAGASIMELAWHRAAWARALMPTAGPQLFDIEKVADEVYCALARAQAEINANAAIFVNASDVLVVDAHSKPSAAASLIAQIKREITPYPVRYVVNTHFHWDHTQGNHAYRIAGGKIDFIASEPTKQLMSDLALQRLQASLEEIPKQIEALRAPNFGPATPMQDGVNKNIVEVYSNLEKI